MKFKKLFCPLLLTGFTLILICLALPDGFLWGSNVDWLSQHVGIAEHMRQLIWDQKTLLPDFSPLGGGSNGFQLAYYGYLRPDILLACLLPWISAKTILIVYAATGMIASVNLCYYWLKRQGFETFFCFLGSFLVACAACFFQTHRQIMFVNYLPFLFLALLSIDRYLERKKKLGLVISLFLIFIHSFYFSISCMAVCFIYLLYRKRDLRTVLYYALSCALAVGLAGALLLPTGLVILNNAKDGGSAVLENIWSVDFSLKALWYHHYGCGLTVVCGYALLASIFRKKTRPLALTIFLCFFLNICSYLLNGTLYVRSKIFIPFLPLVILLSVMELQALYKKEVKPNFILAVLLAVMIAYFQDNRMYVVDAVVLLAFLIAVTFRRSPAYYLLLCVMPPLIWLQTSEKEQFVPKDHMQKSAFAKNELEDFYKDNNYRFDIYTAPYTNANFTPVSGMKRTSMYSSTMNSGYSHFFYDIMKNPISIRNRTALLPGPDPFFEYLMGIRYVEAPKEQVSAGYKIYKEKNGFVLAENLSVLPAAYVSYRTISEKAFDKLDFPEALEAITGNTVVKGASSETLTSAFREEKLDVSPAPDTDRPLIEKDGNEYEITADHETTMELDLKTPIRNQIAVLSFDIENHKSRDAAITINGTRNKLSGKNAPYPNGNNNFTYFLSSSETLDTLKIVFTKGNYTVSNLKVWIMDIDDFPKRDIEPLRSADTSGKDILNGTVTTDKDGYFVTSLPLQKGYEAQVDGKKVNIENVDKAFVGFPLEKGSHEIKITFHAPGKSIGLVMSLVSLVLLFILAFRERRYNE